MSRATGLVADLGDPSARLEWPAWALAKDPEDLAQGLIVIWVELPGIHMGGSRMGLGSRALCHALSSSVSRPDTTPCWIG